MPAEKDNAWEPGMGEEMNLSLDGQRRAYLLGLVSPARAKALKKKVNGDDEEGGESQIPGLEG